LKWNLVSPRTQAAELLNQQSPQLIDVRQDYEWDAERIAGARHVELAAQADTHVRQRSLHSPVA
jgi:rhodanese-related sulfurtransferase